ncbi:MAG: sialic acid TRAP transporter substrate-binding protein SiaP [Lachnospiraceae bacterium]|nr:sialic acid TRAP transporter substrate-binding protein SiaP [Lachnospiraceae bacterium]
MKKIVKKTMGLTMAAIMGMSLAACSGGNTNASTTAAPATESKTAEAALAETAAEAQGETVTLRLAHSQSTEHLIHETALNFADAVAKKSNGAIKIDVYPAETLGTSAEMADACSNGDVDFYIAATGQYTQRYKPFSIIEAFYMFRDTDHLFKFYESDSYKQLVEGLDETCGVTILAPVYYGARQMTTAKVPLNTPDDFAGLKMRAANEPMPIAAIEALGGTPTPVAYNETYLALQQGVADGQENPPLSILAMKFYEVQKYLNITDHQYQMMNIFMSDVVKGKLSEDQINLLYEAAKEVSDAHNEKALDAEQKAIEELGTHMEIVNTDKAAFAEKMKPMYEKFKSDWIEGMYEDIQAIQ